MLSYRIATTASGRSLSRSNSTRRAGEYSPRPCPVPSGPGSARWADSRRLSAAASWAAEEAAAPLAGDWDFWTSGATGDASCAAMTGAAPFAKRGDTDHADVLRASRACRIRVGDIREIEGRSTLVVLAPALDLQACARVEHVAGLVGRRGLAADGVDTVDADDGEHTPVRAVSQSQRVLVTGLARDVALGAEAVLLERTVGGAIVDLGPDQRAGRRLHRREPGDHGQRDPARGEEAVALAGLS